MISSISNSDHNKITQKCSAKTQSTNQSPHDERNRKYKKKIKNALDDENIVQTAIINNGANNKKVVKKSSKVHDQFHSKNYQVNQRTIQVATKNKSKKNKNYYWNNRHAADDEVDASSTTTITLPIPPPAIKFERSHSFFLNRKLTNIYNELSDSIESLKNDSTDVISGADASQNVSQKDAGKKPSKNPAFKFMRSVSLAAITIRKDYRSSMRKPKLEQLSEEDSHASNSHQSWFKRTKHDKKCDTNNLNEKPTSASASASVDSLCSRTSEKSTFSLMSSLKRTFSLKPNRRKSSNPKWSASLLNLQQIDNMISYEDLSFIDYDKFNRYEENLRRHLSQQDVQLSNRRSNNSSCSTNINNSIICMQSTAKNHLNRNVRGLATTHPIAQQSNLKNNHINVKHFMQFPDVKMRLRQNAAATATKHRRHSTIYQCLNPYNDDNNKNFPIHAEINAFNNKFKRWSNPCDISSVEGVQMRSSYASAIEIQRNHMHEHFNDVNNEPIYFVDGPILDASNKRSKSVYDIPIDQQKIHDDQTLKSKSLSHLDELETNIVAKQSQAIHTNSFHVYFDINAVSEKEELLPAIKGVTLGEVLNKSLQQRNLTASQLAIYELLTTDAPEGIPTTKVIIVSEKTDAESLSGKYLIVIEKESLLCSPAQQKINSVQSNLPRPMRLYSSVSAEETTDAQNFDLPKSTIVTVKPSKYRWSGLFSPKNPQIGQLTELLNSYVKNKVPKSKTIYSFEHSDYAPALQYMKAVHGSWQEFVNVDDLNDHEIRIQSTIWELVITEVEYIRVLQTVTELFLPCLEGIQAQKILINVDQWRLFANIREICEANVKFWAHFLYPMVQNSIQSGEKMSIDYLRPCFEQFSEVFAPYKVYCIQQSTSQHYWKELNASNTLFKTYLAWCEAHSQCNRLRLGDIIVRPTQRLTKYGVLLRAIGKQVAKGIYASVLESMIHSVESFVSLVDTDLSVRQETERMKGIMARIESYDVVDTNNDYLEKLVKPFSTMFDLSAPMIESGQERHLFMEGDLRYKDSTTKVDAHCFLLTDMLLVCKQTAKKFTLKVIRQPFQINRLNISIKDTTLYLIYLNRWDVATAAFTLQSPEAQCWMDSFQKAKLTYATLNEGTPLEIHNIKSYPSNEMLCIRRSPLNSSVGSRLSSLNNSHSGSVELNDSRNISMDYEKANSLSSEENMHIGAATPGGTTTAQGSIVSPAKKLLQFSPSAKLKRPTPNTLHIEPEEHIGQSLPNLNENVVQTGNKTLLVPCTSGHSNLLSPSNRGISYPPVSPRATLRRGLAFSSSIKNPPLLKSRNITSQSSLSASIPIPVIGSKQQPPNTSPQSIESTAGIEKTKETSAHAKNSNLV